jgi:hypothetical protein
MSRSVICLHDRLRAQCRRSGAILGPLASVFGELVIRAVYRRLWDAFVGGDAGRYGRVIWGTRWTIDRVASRAVR